MSTQANNKYTNLKQLEVKTYKNFSDLCKALGLEPISSHNSKKALLTHLNSHYIMEIRPNKTIQVTGKRETPLPVASTYHKDSAWSTEEIHGIIINHILDTAKDDINQTIFIKKYELAVLLNLVSQCYYFDKADLQSTSLPYQDFFYHSSTLVSSAVTNCINSLAKKAKINIIETYRIRYHDNQIGYASGKEIQAILEAKAKLNNKWSPNIDFKSYFSNLNKILGEIIDKYNESSDTVTPLTPFTILEKGYVFTILGHITLDRLEEKYITKGKNQMASKIREKVLTKFKADLENLDERLGVWAANTGQDSLSKEEYTNKYYTILDEELGEILGEPSATYLVG